MKLSQLIDAVKGIVLGKSLNGLVVLRLTIWPFLFTSLLWLLRDKEWCVCSIKVQFSIHWSNFLNHYNLENSRPQTITSSLFNSQWLSALNMILAQCKQLRAFLVMSMNRLWKCWRKLEICYEQRNKKCKYITIWCWCCSFSLQLLLKTRLREFFLFSLACKFIENETPPWKFWEVFPPVTFY